MPGAAEASIGAAAAATMATPTAATAAKMQQRQGVDKKAHWVGAIAHTVVLAKQPIGSMVDAST